MGMDALLLTSEGDPGQPVARGPGAPHLVQLDAQRHPAPVSSLHGRGLQQCPRYMGRGLQQCCLAINRRNCTITIHI